MTDDKTPTPREPDPLARPCPTCGALSGMVCTDTLSTLSGGGRVVANPHTARLSNRPSTTLGRNPR